MPFIQIRNSEVKYILIILFFTCACSTQAQVNLIRNGGMEENTGDTCGIAYLHPSYSPIKYWYQHQGASPDYFQSCSHEPSVAVPYNAAGYQLDASTGSSYVGIATDTRYAHYDEYIMTELIQPLDMSKKYLFTMYVTRSESVIVASNLGFCLEHDSIPIRDSLYDFYTPTSNAFVFQTDTVIKDCENWVKFQYTFSPTSTGLQHLVIGNFRSTGTIFELLSTSNRCGSTFIPGDYASYYLIDDVSLYCLDCDTTSPCPIATPDAFTPNADGINDVWQPLFSNDCMLDSTSYLLHIFDRWGNLIFSSNSFNEPWKGNNAPLGTYVFYLQYDEKGITRKKQGSIELLR